MAEEAQIVQMSPLQEDRGGLSEPPLGRSGRTPLGGSERTPLNSIKKSIKKENGKPLRSPSQARARFASWGGSKKSDDFLASPGNGKEWSPKTKVNGKVKHALSRAAVEAWEELITDYPMPQGLAGRLARASTPFIVKDLEKNLFIVKASLNTVFLAFLYNEEFKNFSRDFSAAPGRTVAAAAESAFRLLCEGKAWGPVQEAVLSAARVGEWRVEVHYNRLVNSGASRPAGGGGVLDRLAAASAALTDPGSVVGSPQPTWAPSQAPEPSGGVSWGREVGA